jgi:tetratricopeptide (TPR) repeat protein
MPRGYLLCSLICIALSLSPRVMATPHAPVVQLTVQPPRYLLTRDNCVGNVLLRELQRQAVLISARDELGLGTRDMVLREPFGVHNTPGITTVLIETRIWRGDQAQICLARFDGTQPVNPYSLADLQVDQSQNTCQQWVGFKIRRDQLVDYPEFIAKCEEASRTTFLSALKSEKVLGDFQPVPVQWVSPGSDAPASPQAMEYLRHMDVFSQYLALRILHSEIASQGASVDRMSALVQAYANLGQLASGQWSQAYKVFFARALLYAQRLVVHENSCPASLYVRAYSRALVGLHAAALEDLDAAAKANTDGQSPAWAAIIRGLCNYDPVAIQQAISIGPWQYRQLATYLLAVVDIDEFPQKLLQPAISSALLNYPGMFVLAPFSTDQGDGTTPRPADEVVNQLPVVLVNTLKGSEMPSSVQYVLKRLSPGDDSYRQIAQARDRLIAGASRLPLETAEPSLGVLADLIEQQEMVAIAHKAVTAHTGGTNSTDFVKLLASTDPILKVHPWHPLIDAMNNDVANDLHRLNLALESVKDRDPGEWIGDAIDNLNLNGDPPVIAQGWRKAANLSADSLVDDYTGAVARAKAIRGNTEHYLWLLRKTSPHSATLMDAWLSSMDLARLDHEKNLYEPTLKAVENEFCNRPSVMESACSWCESLGDFPRSFKLLQQVDQIEPSSEVCDRLAKTAHHLGRHSEAIDYLLRGVALAADDTSDAGSLYQRAANYLIQDHRYTDALQCIQISSDTPTPRTWSLLARCYEAMGRIEDADECFRLQAASNQQSYTQYYLWAKRLGRKDANDIRRKALVALTTDNLWPQFYLDLADDQDRRAMEFLHEKMTDPTDAFATAQLLILAKKLGKTNVFNSAVDVLNQVGFDNSSFGAALKALVESKDLSDGMAGFDAWANRQLEDEYQMDWYSLAGRYLVAAGHLNEGKQYLVRAIRLSPHERENYYLAWRELQKMGENPRQLASRSTTLP